MSERTGVRADDAYRGRRPGENALLIAYLGLRVLGVDAAETAGPDTGPHPVGEEESRAAFTRSGGWSVAPIRPDRVETRFSTRAAPAWPTAIERI